MTIPSARNRRARTLLACAVTAALASIAVIPASTGAWLTTQSTLGANGLSTATLSRPSDVAAVGKEDGSTAVSWGDARSQDWAAANNVTAGVTYTVKRTLPGGDPTTVYTGTSTGFTDPAVAPTSVPFTQISAGDRHTLALDANGDVWAWGYNYYGTLGIGTNTNTTRPVKVPLPGPAREIQAGKDFSVALLQDGTVWTWGRNDCGQLGDGSTTDRSSPVQILKGHFIAALGQLNGSLMGLAIDGDGYYWAWGYNASGQIGDATTNNRLTPYKSWLKVSSISSGSDSSTFAVSSGSMWAWGNGESYQLGNGSTASQTQPVKVLDNIKAAAPGYRFGLAINSNGNLLRWGYDVVTNTTIVQPKLVSFVADHAVSIAAGAITACVVTESSKLYCFGANNKGQIGDGTTTGRQNPTLNVYLKGKAVKAVTLTTESVFAITDSGLYAWGDNSLGVLGTGSTDRVLYSAAGVTGPTSCPSGTTAQSQVCAPEDGTTYGVSYNYLGWVSPTTEATRDK